MEHSKNTGEGRRPLGHREHSRRVGQAAYCSVVHSSRSDWSLAMSEDTHLFSYVNHPIKDYIAVTVSPLLKGHKKLKYQL